MEEFSHCSHPVAQNLAALQFLTRYSSIDDPINAVIAFFVDDVLVFLAILEVVGQSLAHNGQKLFILNIVFLHEKTDT